MINVRSQGQVNRVCVTLDAASAAQATGRLDSAITLFVEAEQLLCALIKDDPDEPSHTQALGSALYAAGEVRLTSGDAAGAVECLRGAEEAYQALHRFNWPAAELARLVADVRLRRARALVALGRSASALVDAQAAVQAYTDGWSGAPHEAIALDVARVLSWSAWVTAMVGDLDVAVAAADTAIRIYLARAADINVHLATQALHVPTFALATGLAAVIHRARGRIDVANQAAKLASTVGDATPVTLPSTAMVASALTLDDALSAANAPELQAELVAPPTAGRIRVPIERAPSQLAPVWAARLAAVAERILDENPSAGLRIALEAHAMFAGASELEVLGMRHGSFDNIPPWIALLARAGEVSQRLGRRELARDFNDWLVGAIAVLIPSAPVLAEPALSSVRQALIWQDCYLSSIGESAAAQSCRSALKTFDSSVGRSPQGRPVETIAAGRNGMNVNGWKDRVRALFGQDRQRQSTAVATRLPDAQSAWEQLVGSQIIPALEEIKSTFEAQDGTSVAIEQAATGENWVRLTWSVAPSPSLMASLPPSMRKPVSARGVLTYTVASDVPSGDRRTWSDTRVPSARLDAPESMLLFREELGDYGSLTKDVIKTNLLACYQRHVLGART